MRLTEFRLVSAAERVAAGDEIHILPGVNVDALLSVGAFEIEVTIARLELLNHIQ